MLSNTLERTRSDTTLIREVIRDTTVVIAADSSMVSALIECDSMGRAYLRELKGYRSGKRLAPPHLTISGNVLTVTAQVDSTQIYLRLRDRYEKVSSHAGQTESSLVEVNRLTPWQSTQIRLFWWLAAILVVVAGYKVYRFIKL